MEFKCLLCGELGMPREMHGRMVTLCNQCAGTLDGPGETFTHSQAGLKRKVKTLMARRKLYRLIHAPLGERLKMRAKWQVARFELSNLQHEEDRKVTERFLKQFGEVRQDE
jgi:hypothetical protein